MSAERFGHWRSEARLGPLEQLQRPRANQWNITFPRTSWSFAFLLDLDGTLVDSVYQHVLAWREALQEAGVKLAVWRIHQQIRMSRELLINALLRETGHPISQEEAERLQRLHATAYAHHVNSVRLLPGAQELLDCLSKMGSPMLYRHQRSLRKRPSHTAAAHVASQRSCDYPRSSPPCKAGSRSLFPTAAERLGVPVNCCMVVGDSVWNLLAARRAWAIGIGLLAGGYGPSDRAGCSVSRLSQGPADLLRHLDEVGIQLVQ